MANIVKLAKNGYGQVELNQVAFRRDGRVEAQCKLDATEFPAGSTAIGSVAENGMLFAIDQVNRTLAKATGTLAAAEVIGFHYSAEKLYDERKPQLRNFYVAGGEDFLPRLGYLAVGDKFHTNTVCYDTDTYKDVAAIKAALAGGTKVYAGIATDDTGYWELVASAPAAGPVARLVEVGTMPDGQVGLKFQIIKV